MVVAIGHQVAVVEMEMKGACWVSAVSGGVGWAESRPLSTVVECDHRNMCGVCRKGCEWVSE